MKKKGFTLIELLAVIIILGLVMTIAVTSIGNLTKKSQERMLDEKIRFIEESAVLYGQDMRGSVVNSPKKYKNKYSCITIEVNDLVPEYLDKDVDNCEVGTNCIVNPLSEKDYLDNYNIVIYYRNNRINAKFDKNDDLVCAS